MKYILYNDIKTCFNKNKYIIVIYFLVILSFIYFKLLMQNSLDYDLFSKVFGLNCTTNSGMLEILMYIYNIILYIYLILVMVSNDLKNNVSNIFLRMSMRKWMLTKLLSITMITLLLKLLSYIFVFIIYYINGAIIGRIFEYLFISSIWMVCIELLILYAYILLKNKTVLTVVIVGFLLINYKYLVIDFANYEKIMIPALITIFMSAILLLFSKKYISIFENIN